MKKSKLTAQHLIIVYPTTTGTTRGSDAATKQYLLLNRPSSRRLILLTRNFIQNVFCTPKESTRVSNASSFAKHSELLHLLPIKTARTNTSVDAPQRPDLYTASARFVQLFPQSIPPRFINPCVTPGLQKDINRAIIYVPGSSHTYIQQNEQYITAHIT